MIYLHKRFSFQHFIAHAFRYQASNRCFVDIDIIFILYFPTRRCRLETFTLHFFELTEYRTTKRGKRKYQDEERGNDGEKERRGR